MTFTQAGFDVRCEWGAHGIGSLSPSSDVVILVDVLSFSTALDVATARGGIIYPYPLKGEAAAAYATSIKARLAASKRGAGLSLSPSSLIDITAGTRLVLPSPNGAALAFACSHARLLAGCFRNARAAARLAERLGTTISVIPAGETWDTGELRPSIEDLLGAGAIIASLSGKKSPEARLAAAAFEHFRHNPGAVLRECVSARELIERGFSADVEIALELDVSENVPRLVDRAFVAA